MLEIPRRISLSSQIAAAIRKGIEDGVWDGTLPGERRLCELFQASRPTVHSALRALAKDGWFEIRPGRRNQLQPHGSRRARKPIVTPSISSWIPLRWHRCGSGWQSCGKCVRRARR